MTSQNEFSRIKEVITSWNNVRQMLRSGDAGHLVPVVIPRSRRGFGWLFLAALGIYLFGMAIFSQWNGQTWLAVLATLGSLVAFGVAGAWLYWSSIVEIEQGTTGILTSYGKIERTLPPGRQWLWMPWHKVAFIVNTSTEIPYTAPVLASPTRENVPLKSIEFFLKFLIEDPILFVRNIGASNFDNVLSSAVQDAIRRRSRQVEAERAYDLRGSDVGDMADYLNRQMKRYGVRITGANIPDVQLPDQYRENLATRERVAKELSAYEKEWELIRKRRIDTLLLEIERAKKDRDARLIEVQEAVNKARQDVANMLQQKEAEAEKIRLEIEAKGQAELKSAENEAKALNRLGKAYKDNRAVLQYELARQRLAVAEQLVSEAPRPLIVNSEGGGDGSLVSTMLMAQLLPQMMGNRVAEPERQQIGNNMSRREMFEQLVELARDD